MVVLNCLSLVWYCLDYKGLQPTKGIPLALGYVGYVVGILNKGSCLKWCVLDRFSLEWSRVRGLCGECFIYRVGQNRIYTYTYTVYLVISKPKIPYVHRIYMVLANPIHIPGSHLKWWVFTVSVWNDIFWITKASSMPKPISLALGFVGCVAGSSDRPRLNGFVLDHIRMKSIFCITKASSMPKPSFLALGCVGCVAGPTLQTGLDKCSLDHKGLRPCMAARKKCGDKARFRHDYIIFLTYYVTIVWYYILFHDCIIFYVLSIPDIMSRINHIMLW